jgi:hypothetical protein
VNVWRLRGFSHAYSGLEAVYLVRRRWDFGTNETWFEDDAGRLLHVVTNGDRALVWLSSGADDPGEHAINPGVSGISEGYQTETFQRLSLDDYDTVPLGRANDLIKHVVDVGTWPDGTPRASGPLI